MVLSGGMATVRSNPIPAGRYWSDLIGDNAIGRWQDWRAKTANSGGVTRLRLVTTAHHPADGDAPVREWVLYELTEPVFYDHEFFAPVNDGTGINDESDTVQRPDPMTSLGLLESIFGAGPAGAVAKVISLAVVGVTAVALVRAIRATRRPR